MKPYPAYKASGVEWLGMVPEGWEVRRLRQMVRLQTEKATTTKNPIALENIEGWSGRIIATDTEFEGNGVAFEAGDILFGKLRPYLAKVAVAQASGEAVGDFHVLRPSNDALSRFLQLELLTPSVISTIDSSTYGSKMPRVSWEFMADLRFPLPPLPEQQAIAAFLDRETAKIDGLIEEQRRLIALLAEKRQATISHAVTRGLNPAARLKPSGVDWLGDIPEGWEVVPLKWLCSVLRDGTHLPPPRVDDGIPLLSVRNIQNGRFSLRHDDSMISYDDFIALSRTFTPNEGDVLLAIVGATLGKSAIVPPNMPNFHIQRSVALFRPKPTILNEWLNFHFCSDGFQKLIWSSVGFSAQPGIYLGTIAEIRIPVPPVCEQNQILKVLLPIITHLDALTETATSAITLLHERRAALISAAVTGKIDLREASASPAKSQQSMKISAMLGGVVIAAHGRHAGFGRMMVQKFLFMAQAHAGIHEIDGHYMRMPAGPLDAGLQDRVEADLVAAGLARVGQEGGRGSRVKYEFLGEAAALRADLVAVLGDRMTGFNYLIEQLGSLTKNGIEAVATLYAAWNDFLIDGRTPDRADIIREVLENWHPEKSRKFAADELGTWLDWMERQNIVPDGTGPQTQTGRLFP